MNPLSSDILHSAQELFEYTRDLRRDFHRHPELGFQEFRTAGVVARELNSLGLEVTTGIAKTGVVALLEGTNPGPVVLLRFDMDGLPIQEETGADYASQNPNVMHACGHDGHTAVGLTVARILVEHRSSLSGTIKLVFQPAEEGLGGASQMLAEGVLENPKPDAALAFHLWNNQPVGWLGISPGAVMAASEIFSITISGKGGHGALPDLATDPILASAQVISALQSIVARNVSPLQTAVLSVTTVHGGDAFNVIPSKVNLSGTIRTFDPAVRKMVLQRFREVVIQVAAGMGCQADVDIRPLTPAVYNDAEVTELVANTAAELFPSSPIEKRFTTMGSEDMAYLMQDVPGCYFLVGSANPQKGLDAPHHHPRFDVDEQALVSAVALMSASVMNYLDLKK